MIEVPVINEEGQVVGQEKLDEALLGTYIRRTLMKQVVVMYQANQRLGHACTKTRGEIRGSGKKLWRQKGTGRARVGAGKAPQWRGGGIALGPKPRDFSYTMPKKARRVALRSALLSKFKDGAVRILNKLEVDQPKTKKVAEILKKASISRSCLLVNDQHDSNLLMSVRNIPFVQMLPFAQLNAHEVLMRLNILFTQKAFDQMKQKYSEKEC